MIVLAAMLFIMGSCVAYMLTYSVHEGDRETRGRLHGQARFGGWAAAVGALLMTFSDGAVAWRALGLVAGVILVLGLRSSGSRARRPLLAVGYVAGTLAMLALLRHAFSS